MSMLHSLPINPIQPDNEGKRTCGTCLERLPVTKFYRDGKDADGSEKYRRDCKECYRKNRLMARRAKRMPDPIEVKPKRRRSKKK